MTIRTRIAPSPTGEDIHIGNLYTALMNYAWAKKNNGKFIIRIEDTDRERFVKGSEEKILASLKDYGLIYNEGPDIGGPHSPYRQSERLEIYKEHAEELIKKENAYFCFCTKERLEELRKQQIADKKTPRYDKFCLTNTPINNAKEKIASGEKYVIRLNVQKDKKISFNDLIRGEITFETNEIDDQVLLKSDGFPTYHLGVVVDDYIMGINYIIRAEEWISSTPKHIILYNSFGWELPVFAHMPILRNPDRSKLSKRKNPVWAQWYLKEGYLPEAVINFLSLMGWSHPEEKEIFSLTEFIELFDLKDIKPVGPIFDLQKLTWMNQQYIASLTDEDLTDRLKVFSQLAEEMDKDLLTSLIPLIKTRIGTLKEFEDLVTPVISQKIYPPRNEAEEDTRKILRNKLSNVNIWQKDAILSACKEVMEESKIRMPVLYYLLTGKEKGLPLPEILEMLGKEAVLKRLT